MQSGPDAFDESRLDKTFLIVLGVTQKICSFRLAHEGKARKEIPESPRLEFLEKFFANSFTSSDAEDNTLKPLNRGGIADLQFAKTPECHVSVK